MILDIKQEIVLITPEGREEETVTRLSRIGYDNSNGVLKGGIDTWVKAGDSIDTIETISAVDFAKKAQSEKIEIMDVRKESEFTSEHIEDAINEPLDTINANMDKIDNEKTFYIHCAGGYRSVIFESILKSRGYHNFVDVLGGFGSIKETTDIPTTVFVCPSTL